METLFQVSLVVFCITFPLWIYQQLVIRKKNKELMEERIARGPIDYSQILVGLHDNLNSLEAEKLVETEKFKNKVNDILNESK